MGANRPSPLHSPYLGRTTLRMKKLVKKLRNWFSRTKKIFKIVKTQGLCPQPHVAGRHRHALKNIPLPLKTYDMKQSCPPSESSIKPGLHDQWSLASL